MGEIYNRYRGNTGEVERVAEGEERRAESPVPPPPAGAESHSPPTPPGVPAGELGRLLRRLSPAGLETEDLLLMGILYLLYRDSGDRDFLFAIAGLLFL